MDSWRVSFVTQRVLKYVQRWCCALLMLLTVGCKATENLHAPILPSNDRVWQASLAVLPEVEWVGDEIRIRNVRNCHYLNENLYVVQHDDRSYRLSDLRTVDFIVVPFKESAELAHTMVSFGFADGQYLGISVEARLEQGESYSPLHGALHQFELMYVVADERDLIPLRTEHRDVDVHIYPTKVTPQQAQELFTHMLARVNKLAKEPEFYDLFTNNCTTNLVHHVNAIRPGRIPPSLAAVLLTGRSDRLAYDLGIIDTSKSFEETRVAARVNALAHQFRDAADFSQRIRR
jgi:hypothetical protein